MITTLPIQGMTCNGCVKHVDKALRELPGVSAVEITLGEQRAKVVHDAEQAPVARLIAAVEQAGYTASGPEAS